jgi:hypothetical protein
MEIAAAKAAGPARRARYRRPRPHREHRCR